MILISEIERLIFEVAWPRLVPCFHSSHGYDDVWSRIPIDAIIYMHCVSFVYWVANVFVSSL